MLVVSVMFYASAACLPDKE